MLLEKQNNSLSQNFSWLGKVLNIVQSSKYFGCRNSITHHQMLGWKMRNVLHENSPLWIHVQYSSNKPYTVRSALQVQAGRNHKLEISTAPTKVKSREAAYSQSLSHNKIDRQGVKVRESGRQEGRQANR